MIVTEFLHECSKKYATFKEPKSYEGRTIYVDQVSS
jgi:hypothetical protein